MKILVAVPIIFLIIILPVDMGSVALPRDLDALIRVFPGILNWWL